MNQESGETRKGKAKAIGSSILGILLLLVLIGGFVIAIYFCGAWLIDWFSSLQKAVATGIIAGFVAVTVSILSLVLGKYYEKKAEIRKEHNEKKAPVYEEFMTFWLGSLVSARPDSVPIKEEEVTKFFLNFTQKIIIWGSDDVLKSYVAFREALTKANANDEDYHSMFLLEDLMLKMRKDLGHKNKNINSGDVLATFINDIRKYDDDSSS